MSKDNEDYISESRLGEIQWADIGGRVQLPIATPRVVKRLRRPDLSDFTAKWSCSWVMVT
jgi:hypothetical protein